MEKELLKKYLENGYTVRKIAEITNYSSGNVGYWIYKFGLENLIRYKKKPNYKFDKIDTIGKAYSIGFILGDSFISEELMVEVSTSIKDSEIVEYISTIIDANVNYSYFFDKKTKRFPRARLSRKIVDIKKFTGGTKKEDRHYPRIREDLEKYLIQGFFDAEGCIAWGRRKDKNRIWQKVSFTSQEKILYGVQQYLYKKLNIPTILRKKAKENCYVLEFSNKKNVLIFLDHIYKDNDFIILKRKYDKYKALRLELEENGETCESNNTVPSIQSMKV